MPTPSAPPIRLDPRHPSWSRWVFMMTRCYLTTSPSYPNYGGRGITVCERWHDWKNFLRDMGVPPTKEHQLGRIDNDGPYSPENCRWETRRENALNKSNTVKVSLPGRGEVPLAQAAQEAGVSEHTAWARLKKYGMSAEAALNPDPLAYKSRARDLTGQVFGRLTVLRLARTDKAYSFWVCSCACGNEVEVSAKLLRGGSTRSCGCLLAEYRANMAPHKTHGKTHTPTYVSWVVMRRRFPTEVCERWKTSFSAFEKDMGEKPEGTSLRRIDKARPYESGNCSWA